MAYFSKSARKEFVDAAKSDKLQQEFDYVRKNRIKLRENSTFYSADSYIEFVSQYNKFINHRPKQFQKISGTNWKL